MSGKKNQGKNESKKPKGNAAGASTNKNDASKRNNATTASTDVTARSMVNSQGSSNPPQNKPKSKQKPFTGGVNLDSLSDANKCEKLIKIFASQNRSYKKSASVAENKTNKSRPVIPQIESGPSEAQENKHNRKDKVESSSTPYPDLNRKPVSNSKEENAPSSFKDPLVSTSANQLGTEYSRRFVIFATNKSTQIDLLPKPSSISKETDGKISASVNYDSDSTTIAEAAESASVALPNEEEYLRNIDIWKKTGSNSRSDDANLQSINDDFLRCLKVAAQKCEEGFTKCLESNK